MPRNPTDEAIAQLYPQDIAAISTAMGATAPDQLSDAEFRAAVNEVVRTHADDLHNIASVNEGLSVDPKLLAGALQGSPYLKRRPVEITLAAAREFAAKEFGDGHVDSISQYNAVLTKSQKVDAAFREKYGSPNGE